MSGCLNGLASDQGMRFGTMVIGMALLGVVVPATSVRAMPIRSSLVRWEQFVEGGPRVWKREHAPPLVLSVRRALQAAVMGRDATVNPFVQYLTWRRSLNPARFDHWHPFLGPRIHELLPHLPHVSRPSVSPHERPPLHPEPQVIPPVPEPDTILIAMALIGSGVWWRKRYRR